MQISSDLLCNALLLSQHMVYARRYVFRGTSEEEGWGKHKQQLLECLNSKVFIRTLALPRSVLEFLLKNCLKITAFSICSSGKNHRVSSCVILLKASLLKVNFTILKE